MRLTSSVRACAATAALVVAAAGMSAASAQERVVSAFDGRVPCTLDSESFRVCSGGATRLVPSFDGTPVDVSLVLPPAPAEGPDGGFPLVGVYHGYAGTKASTASLKVWAKRGYATFAMTARGFGNSCGQQGAERLSDACRSGYTHLMDTRYEVRDAQHVMGLLADQDVDGRPLIDSLKIGATGGSYGGGLSLALGALRNRVMLQDDTLVPWRSPGGRPMEIAAATPSTPWSDLAYSLFPTGRTLDYTVDNPYGSREGIAKTSYVSLLYAGGAAAGFVAPPGVDADADLTKWYGLATAGETSDLDPAKVDVIDELTRHHSAYYIDASVAPAPMLIASGWTDDLFPADEALRFYNRTRTQHPGTDISLVFADYGHARGQGKSADQALVSFRQRDWMAHYLKGDGTPALRGVEVTTQTCPETAKPGSYLKASSWAALSPGEVAYTSEAQQVVSSAGDPRTALALDPVSESVAGRVDDALAGTGAEGAGSELESGACAQVDDQDSPGTAVYRLPPAEGAGYTLLGSPTVVADVLSPGPTNQLAARLLDVAPDGTATLVARTVYRPDVSTGAATRQVFQLHANGWHFAVGHAAKLELLTADAPYARPSNGQTPVLVSGLELRLPVRQAPGGVVREPAAPVVPAGATLAPDYAPSAPTEIALTAPPSGRDTDVFPVSARLTAADLPLAGRSVTFRGAGATAISTTDADGVARAVLTADGPPSRGAVVAEFPGGEGHRPSTAAVAFELLPEITSLSYTGPTAVRGEQVTMSASLTEDDGPAVPGQTVTFTIAGRDYVATTDADGRATATAHVPDHGREQAVTAVFAGTARRTTSSASAVVRWGSSPS